jgi:hypothetical protein
MIDCPPVQSRIATYRAFAESHRLEAATLLQTAAEFEAMATQLEREQEQSRLAEQEPVDAAKRNPNNE